LILGWLAIAGFGNAVVWRTAKRSFQMPESSPIWRFLEAASSPLFTVLALCYGATALAACVGIWRMRPWMDKAFLAWAIAVVTLGLWMSSALPGELLLGGKLAGVAFVTGMAALLWAWHRYVQRLALRAAL
jgi:hypothetical protein